MLTPTWRDPAAVEAGGKIYVVGGCASGRLNDVEEYDPASNTWTTKAPMPTARYGLAAAEAGGKIYAIGGDSSSGLNLDEADAPDPRFTNYMLNQTWTPHRGRPPRLGGSGPRAR